MKADHQNAETRDPGSGLIPPEIVNSPGAAYRVESRQWQGIPGIERVADGRLWATWYTGGTGEGPGNHVVLATSGDDGARWEDPVLVVDPGPARRAFDPCLWCDPTGRLWLFWAQVGENEYFDGRGGVWAITTENPETGRCAWSAPRRLCHGVMMNKPTVLGNGDWLLPAAVWFQHGASVCNPPPKPDADLHRGSGVVASADQGRSWQWRGAVVDAPGRTFDEHMFVEKRDGTLWMLFRTLYGVGQSTSRDGGFTWTRARATEIESPDTRFFIRRLQSGALLLVNHQLSPGKTSLEGRSHLTALVSDDEGRTWVGGLLLDERYRVSYPDGVQAPDGTITVVYDHNRGDRWASADDREILMAVFREEDVRAGRPASGSCRLRQRISKIPETSPHAPKERPGWKPREAKP